MFTVVFTLSLSPGPEFSRETWLSVKNTLGLDFPNVSTFSLFPRPGAATGIGTRLVHHKLKCFYCLYAYFTAAIFD